MDEFGVLVESIGFKPHGKSAPMALAPKPKSHFAPTVNTSSFHDSYSLSVDQLDGIFRSNVSTISKPSQFSVDDDIFGGGSPIAAGPYNGVDLDSVFSSSTNRNSASSDDLFGGFGVSSGGNQGSGFDDLLSGFGGVTQSKNRVHTDVRSNDPFSIFEPSPVNHSAGKGPLKPSSKGLGDFSIGGPPRSGSKVGARPSSGTSTNADYLDAIFGGSSNAARPNPKSQHVKQTSSQSSYSRNKTSSATSIGNDFTSLFGDVTTSSGEFPEVKGEPTERRTARLKRHMKTNERMAEALAEKNQRDLEIQREQEEKHRLAETLDSDIKKWAAGKEGNLRALLCSLHQVFGAESGWRPVPLTDMITSVSVKKVYKKATLFVHPDKVQQRGASLHQKYVAEKVFDILKEASNKFSAEELR